MIDKAEDFGKISKLKFEIRQISSSVEKKLTVWGDAVFPHLLKNDVETLKDNPAIKLLVEELQDLNKHFELMVYVNSRHGYVYPKSRHAKREEIEFWFRHFFRNKLTLDSDN